MINPVAINEIPRVYTLAGLREEFDYSFISPITAHKAVSIRESIIHECDVKGYETPEDTDMMAYLWEVRCAVVNHIVANELKHEETRRAQQRVAIEFDRMSQQDKDKAYELYQRRS